MCSTVRTVSSCCRSWHRVVARLACCGMLLTSTCVQLLLGGGQSLGTFALHCWPPRQSSPFDLALGGAQLLNVLHMVATSAGWTAVARS